MLNYRVLKGGQELDIHPYEFQEDFGEAELLAKAEEEELPEEDTEEGTEEPEKEEPGKKELEEAMRQAEEILETARARAGEIAFEAKENAKETEQEGRRKGYDEGFKNGYDDGYKKAYQEMTQKMEDELAGLRDQMHEVIDSVAEEKEKVLEQYLDDLKRICLAVSEKIIQTSLRSSGEVIKRMIVAATDKIKKTQWAKIYISKQDAEMLVKGDVQLLREMAHLTDNLKVVAMENEDPGTCIIELPDEIVDASVNTQMENIKDILNNARL